MNRLLVLSLLFAFLPLLAKDNLEEKVKVTCTSAKEFITAHSYLKDKKEYAINDKQRLELAHEIAQGCTGASVRFVSIVDMLVASKLDVNTAIKTAKKFIHAPDDMAQSFREIFKKTYLEKYLDLDLKMSMDLSVELATSFEGDPKKVFEDFEKITDFCLKEGLPFLPKPECAKLAHHVALKSTHFKENLAPTFVDLYRFLTDSSGPNRSAAEALKITQDLIQFGPLVLENFKESYKFAVSPRGLGQTDGEALAFAKKIATYSVMKVNEKN